MGCVILVLEDMGVRVDRLRELAPGAEVFWSQTVDQLSLDLDNVTPDLVVLDHDLGGVPTTIEEGSAPGPFSRDANGHTGLDACERMPVVACPVLVWSVNPVRAPQMVQTLRRRGMRTGWAPFGTTECTAAIVHSALAAVTPTPSTRT